MNLHFARALCQLFQDESVNFILILRHDLGQPHFFFSNFEIVLAQCSFERNVRWRNRRSHLNAIPIWQCEQFHQMLLIAFRSSCASSSCSWASNKLQIDCGHRILYDFCSCLLFFRAKNFSALQTRNKYTLAFLILHFAMKLNLNTFFFKISVCYGCKP